MNTRNRIDGLFERLNEGDHIYDWKSGKWRDATPAEQAQMDAARDKARKGLKDFSDQAKEHAEWLDQHHAKMANGDYRGGRNKLRNYGGL